MYIEEWFCSPIASFQNENFDLTDHCLKIKDENPMDNHAKMWIHNPYNSLSLIRQENGYNAIYDPKFFKLNQWVQKCVNEFSEECGYQKMGLINMWFNVYEKGDSQEFHNHGESHFSCVYYAKAEENDSNIIFNRSPWPMMHYNIVKSNRLNFNQVRYKPVMGSLLVFKSDTMHMVEKKVTDDIRISFSFNFVELARIAKSPPNSRNNITTINQRNS